MTGLVLHRNYVSADIQLKRCLLNHRPGRLIIIVGVGGVGKTCLRWSVLRDIYGQPSAWGLGQLPVVEVMALLAEKAYFNSKSLAEESLRQVLAPDLNWLTRGSEHTYRDLEQSIAESRDLWLRIGTHTTEAATWNRFKTVANSRGVKIYSLEHASALRVNHKDATPAHHIINLMSIMECIGSMGLLTTIQNGVDLWSSRSEIRRRADVIWLAPYDVKNPEDLRCFIGLLKKLSEPYVFSPPGLIKEMAPEIAAATATVYAEIVNLFERARDNSHLRGSKVIVKKDIHNAYYSTKELDTLWRDVDEFWDARRSVGHKDMTARADGLWPRAKK